MATLRSRGDPTGFPTLPDGHDLYFTNLHAKYFTGIITSTATYSVGTAGATVGTSAVTYGALDGLGTPGKLACDRTWKIKDDEGNDFYIPLFRYG